MFAALILSVLDVTAELRVGNPEICTADETVCVVVRQQESIPDFQSIPAHHHVSDDEPRTEYVAAVYAGRQFLWTMRVPASASNRHVTREYFVTVGYAAESLVHIQRITGETEHVLTAKEVFGPRDLLAFEQRRFTISSSVEGEHGRELLVLQLLDEKAVEGEIAIDLAAGKRVGPPVNALAVPRLWATASEELPPEHAPWSPTRCLGTADTDPPPATPISSDDLLARAVSRPLELTQDLKSLRVGTVFFDVTIAANGAVLCTSAIAIPPGSHRFALDDMLRKWTFAPAAEAYRGELQFHFDVIDDEECSRTIGCDPAR